MLYIIILIIVVVLLTIYYIIFRSTKLCTTHYEINDCNTPDEYGDLKILQLSDFHNSLIKNMPQDVVEVIKKENPHIIVLTGDFIDSRRTRLDIAFWVLDEIKDIAPIYFCGGNHEGRMPIEYGKLKDKMISCGVNILENKCELYKRNNNTINILGINDPEFITSDETYDKEIANDELDSIDYDKEKFSILLSHRPELFDIYKSKDIDLIFCGHAHGGQIRLPIIGGVASPHQNFLPKYTSGVNRKGNSTMVVSRGLCNRIFPFRINNRPEIVVVTLKR